MISLDSWCTKSRKETVQVTYLGELLDFAEKGRRICIFILLVNGNQWNEKWVKHMNGAWKVEKCVQIASAHDTLHSA